MEKKYLDRINEALREIKDIDKAVEKADCVKEQIEIINAGNHFLIRQIAINSALLVDMIDRLVTDYEPIDISSNDVADALIDAFLRKKGQANNDT